jgi:hypothetical protein
MGWFFACDHGVVGRCPICGSLAEPRRATGALRRQADQVGGATADPDAEATAPVLARDAGRTPWWQRLRSS